MELLQLLFSFLAEEFGDKFKGLDKAFENGTFNLKALLENIDPKIIFSIISEFMSKNKTFGVQNSTKSEGLLPIKNIADEKIVATLNLYLDNAF